MGNGISRSMLRAVALSGVLGVSSFQLTRSMLMGRVHAQSSEAIPVRVSYTLKMYMPSGELFLTKQKEFARFADGTVAKSMWTVEGTKKKDHVTEVMNPVNGEYKLVDEATRSVITLEETPHEVAEQIGDFFVQKPSNAAEGGLPDGGEIAGIHTVHYTVREGDHVDERWGAPTLGWLTLKEVATLDLNGAYNVLFATRVTAGEPPVALRSLAGYEERDPDSVNQLHFKLSGESFLAGAGLSNVKQLCRKGRSTPAAIQ